MCYISFMVQCCFCHCTCFCAIRKSSTCYASFPSRCNVVFFGNALVISFMIEGKLACVRFPSWCIYNGISLMLSFMTEGKLACTTFLSQCNVVFINAPMLVLEGKLVGSSFSYRAMYFLVMHLLFFYKEIRHVLCVFYKYTGSCAFLYDKSKDIMC